MKEKLFNNFISNYNVGSWHPNDAERFYKYVDYCYLNKIDEDEIRDTILESKLPHNIKNHLIQKAITIYECLLIKNNK